MTAQISAYGRLVADPQTRTTSGGKAMAMARLAVALPCNTADDGQVTFWLGVLAFGKQADLLAKHVKGDMISVAGNMQVNQWKAQDGTEQTGYQVLADSIISARTSRPNTQPKAQNRPAAPGWEVYDTPDYQERG